MSETTCPTCDALRRQVQILREELTAADVGAGLLRSDCDDLRRQLTQHTDWLNERCEQVTDLRRERHELAEANCEMARTVDSLRRELETARREVDAVTEDDYARRNGQLQRELAEAREECEKDHRRVDDAWRELNGVKARLQAVRAYAASRLTRTDTTRVAYLMARVLDVMDSDPAIDCEGNWHSPEDWAEQEARLTILRNERDSLRRALAEAQGIQLAIAELEDEIAEMEKEGEGNE